MVTEFPWIFLGIVTILAIWALTAKKYKGAEFVICFLSFIFFFYPVGGAYTIGSDLKQRIEHAFGAGSVTLTGLHQHKPYTFWQMIAGIGAEKIPYTTYDYATQTGVTLTLDFYKAQEPGTKPCIVIVHGGSWKSDNSQELPDINWYLARQGYNVASINYRLAPTYKSPSPIEDVHAAIQYLKSHAGVLNVDTNNLVLLGRSAGGQIVLESAYTLHDPGIKGVVSFYGPTDMIWAYNHPDNPLVMDSRQVLRDFLGGYPTAVPQKYFEASPINYVTANSTPTLLIHGGNDAHVHYELSEMLDKKLEDNKVKHLLLGLPWATHGCEYTLNGPSGQLAKYAIERFVYSVTHGTK
jgi:acetyl esterase/lipase